MRHLMRRIGQLPYLVSGRPIFDSPLYRESELSRLANLFAHVDVDRWRGRRVLEVGAGLGHLGDAFRHLGFDVTSSDGRPDHVARMEAAGKDAMVLDLDSFDSERLRGYDLILAFGVLYHLANPERFLDACGEHASVLLLESAVLDHSEPVLEEVTEASGRRGQDQALRSQACRPSPAWVERTCRAAGFDAVRDISSPIGNWSIGVFDWDVRSDGKATRDGLNLRRMWVCEKT